MGIRKEINHIIRYMLPRVVIVIGSVYLVFLSVCLLFNQCYLEYDATITEIGICLDTTYQPVKTVPVGTEQIYVCGKVEGTTPRPGVLYLFHKGKVIYQKIKLDLDPGLFHLLYSPGNNLEIGEYKVRIGYARKVIAETTFEVIR